DSPWKQFTDFEANTLKVRAIRDWNLSNAKVSAVWEYVQSSFTEKYHPVKDWLLNLQWDGDDHATKLCSYLKTENDALFRSYFEAWALCAVGQVLDGEPNEYML